METIILTGLPKVSLNKWYAGKHWMYRQKMKGIYKLLVKSQVKKVFPKDSKFIISYSFFFNKNPLDATNCVAMVKMIEDIIFEDDKHDIIDIGGIRSRKTKEKDYVKIKIETL